VISNGQILEISGVLGRKQSELARSPIEAEANDGGRTAEIGAQFRLLRFSFISTKMWLATRFRPGDTHDRYCPIQDDSARRG
jgi:hypothetical protein